MTPDKYKAGDRVRVVSDGTVLTLVNEAGKNSPLHEEVDTGVPFLSFADDSGQHINETGQRYSRIAEDDVESEN